MTYPICILFLSLCEILTCRLLLETFAEKRNYKNNSIPFIIIIISTIIYFATVQILFNYLWLKQIIIVFIMSLIMHFLFKNHYSKIIIWTILHQELQTTTEYLTISIFSKLFPSFYIKIIDNTIVYLLIAFISKTILLCIIFTIKRNLGRNQGNILKDSEWLCFISIPIISIIIVISIILNFNLLKETLQDSIIIYIVLGIVGMNIFMFYTLNNTLKRENIIKKEKFFHEKVQNQLKVYHSISENLSENRKRTHEFKNHLICIQALVEKENYEKLKEYILQINHTLTLTTDAINTNHIFINAILNSKYRDALEKGICFSLKVNDLSQIVLSDTDIVIILSNLIDNAMEACINCKDKIIKLKFVLENEQIILSVKNNYYYTPIKKNGQFLTRKPNPSEHGMGIKNIIEAIERYHGKYTIDYNQDTFSFSILISNIINNK